MTEYNRRATDNKLLDIEALIAEENDPKQRVFLIVLNNINQSLVANTGTIKNVAEKLDTHLTAYETHVQKESAMINRGKGMWTIGAWVLGVAQIAVIAIGTKLVNDIERINVAIQMSQQVDVEIKQRLKVLEERK